MVAPTPFSVKDLLFPVCLARTGVARSARLTPPDQRFAMGQELLGFCFLLRGYLHQDAAGSKGIAIHAQC